MIHNLFSSKVLFDILAFLYKNEGRAFATTEIIKYTKRKQVNVLRELDKLTKWGIVKKEKKTNQNYYELNTSFLQYKELSALFSSVKDTTRSKFVLVNEEGSVSLFGINYFYRGFSSDISVQRGILTKRPNILGHHKGDYAWFYFDQEAHEVGSKESLKKLLNDPAFVDELIYSETKKRGEQALEIFTKLSENDFKAESAQAVKLIDQFSEIIENQIALNTLAIFDLRDHIFSDYLKKYLNTKVANSGLAVNVLMEKLLEPKELTYTQLLRLQILDLALQVKNNKIDAKLPLQKIQKDWQWLNFGYRGPVLEIDFFENMLVPLLNKSANELMEEKKILINRSQTIIEEKNKIFKKLDIDNQHQKYINALSTLSYLKVYRKDTAFLIIFLTFEFLKQFNNRFKNEELYYLTLEEVKDLIANRLILDQSHLKARMKECLLFGIEDNKVHVGPKISEMVTERIVIDSFSLGDDDQHRVKMLEGTTACLGKIGDWVYGKVKIINSAHDLQKMQDGDILVSVATSPEIVAAMKKAGAIITDHGGITSHAAIVSRELNVPCVIGTKYATKLFKDNDLVVVCPRHGYIKFQ